MNKKDLPLALLQSLNRLNTQLIKLAEDNDDLISKTFSEKKLILFKDIDSESNFKFEIVKLGFSGNIPLFSIEMSPFSTFNNNSAIKQLNEKQAILEFQQWINWLKAFEKNHLTPEDEFLKKYQEEFYTEFEIIDEDANTSTFSIKQQIFIDKYLNQLEAKLLPESKQNEEITEIVNDIKSLRTELGKDTKKKIITKFSRIFAKLRRSSIRLLGEIYDAGKKELFKRLISGGVDELTGLL